MKFCLKSVYYILGCISFLFFVSCATPTQPTGGQPDQTPPVIVRTVPNQGTVNFDGDEIRFYFDKYVNRESFANAFRIDPDLRLDYRIRWSGRSVRVQFQQELPDSTTIIFTLGTELSDVNRNRIRAPFVLALSTGSTIDDGKIEGRIIDGKTGKSREGATVLLYRQPYDLTERADYVAQSDSSGRVNFGYLRDGTYKAFWVDDRNRNRTWDKRNEAARPFSIQYVDVNQNVPAQLGILHINEPDTIRPELQGVGLFSSTRLRLRFSREMILSGDAAISITDTLGSVVGSAAPLYIPNEDRTIVFARSTNPLDPNQTYKLNLIGLSDIHGNIPLQTSPAFQGSTVQDTTRVRLIRHETDKGVLDNEAHVFTFSTLIQGSVIVDSLQIVQDEIIYTAWEPIEIRNNRLKILPAGRWQDGSNYTARIFDSSTGTRRDFKLNIFQRNRLGGLEIKVEETARVEGVYHHIQIKNSEDRIVFSGKTQDSVEIENLTPGFYVITMFRDDNHDGFWNRGMVYPFEVPEPIVIERGVRVSERMTGELILDYTPITSATVDGETESINESEDFDEMDIFDPTEN